MYVLFILLMNVFLIQIVVRGRLGDNGQIFLVLQSPSLAVFVCPEFRLVVTLFNFSDNEKMLEPLTGESAFFSRFKGTIDQRGSASSGRLTGPIGL
jgi:hypothetical protein